MFELLSILIGNELPRDAIKCCSEANLTTEIKVAVLPNYELYIKDLSLFCHFVYDELMSVYELFFLVYPSFSWKKDN